MTRSIILIPPHNLLLGKHEINILIIQSKLLTELNNSQIKLYVPVRDNSIILLSDNFTIDNILFLYNVLHKLYFP